MQIFEKSNENLNKRFMHGNMNVENSLLPSLNNLSLNTLMQRHKFI
jgi:hypothetical protein